MERTVPLAEIQSALQTYFDVMYECDMLKFDRIFHPACSLFTAGNEGLVVRPYAKYREEMIGRTPPKSLGQSRTDEAILKIDMLSESITLAQVRVRIHDKLFVDNLNLIKVAGSWMVVAKIYHQVAPATQAA
jgi:hypothetical protein